MNNHEDLDTAAPQEKLCESERESWTCKNMKSTYEDMSGERYRCEQCGRSFWLSDEEMR